MSCERVSRGSNREQYSGASLGRRRRVGGFDGAGACAERDGKEEKGVEKTMGVGIRFMVVLFFVT